MFNQTKKLLLTSFAPWEAHQTSNASDDLLLETLKTESLPSTWHFLRQLPVDFELAPEKAIAHFNQLQPNTVICCGMAEGRTKLIVESRAVSEGKVLHTSVNLDSLIAGLTSTEISHDAGRFVCNGLYYALLEHLQTQEATTCLFVHVPILTPKNRKAIASDFYQILERI